MNLHELFPSWQRRARCIAYGSDLWFPPRGASTKPAKEICTGCSVRQQCLEFAEAEGIFHGIWGGLSERERKRIRNGGAA